MVCIAGCFFLQFKVSKNVRLIPDSVQGGVGVDVGVVCVGFVNYLSCQVGEDYEWVIFGKVWDVENGSCDGEVMWVQGIGGDAGEELPCLKCLGAVKESMC